jgi:hypothetical protein
MRAMKIVAPSRYEIQYHEAPIGIVRSGGIEWISDAMNDEAIFWAGWHGIARQARTARCRSRTPMPAWYLDALRHSVFAAAASKTTG